MQILWLIILAGAIAVEALTADLVAIWFFPSALVSLILSFFSIPPYVQLLVFVVLGLAMTFALRPLLRRSLKVKGATTNAPALIGQTALVTEAIDNTQELGEVKVNGLCWSARSADGSAVPLGVRVKVLEIRGVKLIVEQENET